MPPLRDVKETALYVDDLERAKRFYLDVLRLAVLMEDPRLCALDVNGRHVLLLFLRGGSASPNAIPGGIIPPHDGAGPIHAGFAVDAADLPSWEAHFAAKGVAIESSVTWPRGGRSIYFRDPDGHLLELLTPGIWSTY